MRKLIVVWFLLFFTVVGNAQTNVKNKFSELNQDQLNLALSKSEKNIKTGKVLTITGTVVGTTGFILLIDSFIRLANNPETATYAEPVIAGIFIYGGLITDCIGIPLWAVNHNRKTKIEIELVKFNPKGSASINGIGLKIRF